MSSARKPLLIGGIRASKTTECEANKNMLPTPNRWFLTKKTFMEWEEYKKKVEFLDEFWWRQSVRKQSLRNL